MLRRVSPAYLQAALGRGEVLPTAHERVWRVAPFIPEVDGNERRRLRQALERRTR